ncbi:MAG TPA: PIN domain-containing protein [Thermoanaerobaculia bacterium]|nr:PIN domain-containing protein [Thermoanaerobaculia bacterium]
MARKAYVLDTSALFALIEEEDGAERVEEIMRSENAILPWLVLLETHYITRQERGPGEADRRYALLKQSPCEVLWQIDEPTLLVASRFKADHRLSFADAVIAAIAFRRDAVLLHKDPEYDALADDVKLEALPYKARTRDS